MEVLKGESTAAIYGSRGINGVILITTKKSHTSDDVTNTKFEIKNYIESEKDYLKKRLSVFSQISHFLILRWKREKMEIMKLIKFVGIIQMNLME